MCRNTICENKRSEDLDRCGFCYTETEASIHSRRCFMTGEYCSKQTNIQRERRRLHKNLVDGKEEIIINAFVVMNFSDMSDVVYKWRLRPFIESLTKYLYMDNQNRLYCSATERENSISGMRKINKINVIRADSDPASNYVICSRICQQMQIADLVIVDVSSQNANVFYEFGMAVAFGKLILPICYSESFYKMKIPAKLKGEIEAGKNKELEKHIGCYPWRKKLFEYYGVMYRSSKSDTEGEQSTRYFGLKDILKYGFSDESYKKFPYHEKLKDDDEKIIGEKIYERLSEQYNKAKKEDNTLVVYTADGFLNEKEAGRCIVNFYRNITARMRQEQCFCGERVGVLVQENVIPQGEKDAEEDLNLFYSVGEIIHIGLNQATYLAAEERIKTNDGLKEPQTLMDEEKTIPEKEKITEKQKEDIRRFVKGHIKNRGMLVYPNNPVYVKRLKNGMQEDLLSESEPEPTEMCTCSRKKAFCLYHIMLRTLRYTNEIVVDITDNCLQSLFWLGMAHGSNVHAITVLHEKTADERKIITGTAEKKSRNVFDVAGLWAAVFCTNDTEGFYRQLAMAQLGIERHSRLMAIDREFYEKSLKEYLCSFDSDEDKKTPDKLLGEKRKEERETLESYYRNRFWNIMLRYNRLGIYVSQRNGEDKETKEPVVNTAKWDFDAVSILSYYLSKRTVIGEYLVKALPDEKDDSEAKRINFISVGTFAKPLGKDLAKYIYDSLDKKVLIHERDQITGWKYCVNGQQSIYKGFVKLNEKDIMYTQHPQSYCAECSARSIRNTDRETIITNKTNMMDGQCFLKEDGIYNQIGQLVLWRENSQNLHERSYFRIALNGSSGPSTYGLAALFVDKDQKKEYFEEDNLENCEFLLCELQEKVREKFMETFLGRLQGELDNIEMTVKKPKGGNPEALQKEQKKRYCSLVKHAVSYYLSTVLYRYFLPFVSETDINRIVNGVHIFVCSMRATNTSPFALDYPEKGDKDFSSSVSNDTINEVIGSISKVLLQVLKGFRGLEAFYQIEVKHDKNEEGQPRKDTRKVRGIKMLACEIPEINCFFEEGVIE